ncbi:MAG: c-type cytochrome [Myxococcota bacterium]|nr:c-type cytochrome [Myxococcota bacterium]
MACHGAVGASAGLDLASDLCGTVLDGRLVIEGDSDGSVLFQRIVDTSAPMPPGGMMDESNIEIVRDWIDQGADCSAGEPAGDTGDSGVATGADLYGTRCAACHGDSGQGVSAPAMGAIVPGYDQAGLERVIIEGVGTMPAIGVTVDEAQRVAEYVLDTWGG